MELEGQAAAPWERCSSQADVVHDLVCPALSTHPCSRSP